MTGPARADPYLGNRFSVEVDGLVVGGVAEVRGLSVDVEVRAGSDEQPDEQPWAALRDVIGNAGAIAETVRGRFDGDGAEEGPVSEIDTALAVSDRRVSSPHLELTRGVTDSDTLWIWLREWIDGAADPRDVRVFLLDGEGYRARGWRCRNATPTRWSGPELVADRNAVATETLELAHDGLEAIPDPEPADDG